MDRLHGIVHGRVQGVGFRDATQEEAQRLSLNGWVRNTADRTVEVVAEGERDQLDSLVAFLQKGPPSARVTSLDVEWQDATGEFTQFEIRWWS